MGRSAIVTQIIDLHTEQASNVIGSAGSRLVKKAFKATWVEINQGGLYGSVEKGLIDYDTSEIQSMVTKWITELEACLAAQKEVLRLKDDPSYEEIMEFHKLQADIQHICAAYERLKNKLEAIENEFENAVLIYRSPLQQALTDITLLYNKANNIRGDFEGVQDVSVYVHGIESNGKDFLKSATKAATAGEIVIHQKRNGRIAYYFIQWNENKKVNELSKEYSDIKTLRKAYEVKLEERFDLKALRLHYIYETKGANEHRQKTSADLAEKLTNMGLVNNKTKIDLFGHSYGGRRSFQFAMDFPDSVRSITTIGTPYDRNESAKWTNKTAKLNIVKGFHPRENSGFLDKIEGRSREDHHKLHSNAYTDLHYVDLIEDIKQVKTANPEVYKKLQAMEITAAAGVESKTVGGGNFLLKEERHIASHDGVVHIDSQHAESLKSLIDSRPTYNVKGKSLLEPAHVFQIESPAFVKQVKKVNEELKGVK